MFADETTNETTKVIRMVQSPHLALAASQINAFLLDALRLQDAGIGTITEHNGACWTVQLVRYGVSARVSDLRNRASFDEADILARLYKLER
jgi:hypothetical protein